MGLGAVRDGGLERRSPCGRRGGAETAATTATEAKTATTANGNGVRRRRSTFAPFGGYGGQAAKENGERLGRPHPALWAGFERPLLTATANGIGGQDARPTRMRGRKRGGQAGMPALRV